MSVIRLSLGKLSVNLLQVVKRTNTPLIPYQLTVVHGEGIAPEIALKKSVIIN